MFMCRRIESHRAARPPFQASLEAASGGSPEGDILRCDHRVVECLSLALNCHEGGRPRELGAAAQDRAEQGPGKRQKIETVKGPKGPEERYEDARTALSLVLAATYGAHAARECKSELTPFGCTLAWDLRQSSGLKLLIQRLAQYGLPLPSFSTLDRNLPERAIARAGGRREGRSRHLRRRCRKALGVCVL